jgi:hypothetical protein
MLNVIAIDSSIMFTLTSPNSDRTNVLFLKDKEDLTITVSLVGKKIVLRRFGMSSELCQA